MAEGGSQFLEEFESSEYETEEEIEPEADVSKNSKNIRKLYLPENVFQSNEEAKMFLKTDGFSYHYENKTEDGVKKYYRCNANKRRGLQCPASVYLLYHSISTEISLFKATNEHVHDENNAAGNVGIDENTKTMIKTLFDLNLKPKAIKQALAAKKMTIPNENQLKNFLTKLRNEKFGKTAISIGELIAWLKLNNVVPLDEDKSFVVKYDVSNADHQQFRFVISTRRLLKMSIGAEHLQADATYKLIWQGFPVLVLGTTDRDKKFHNIAISVCSHEKREDFMFLFDSVKNSVKEIFDTDIKPVALVSDASKAIQNAFSDCFGNESIIIMCWYHMHKNTIKQAEKLVAKCNQKEIISDIELLQLCSSKEIFAEGLSLFLQKWKGEVAFIKYFNEEWVTQNPNWFEGIRRLTPSTNNALEACNRVIKDEATFRERLPLSRFTVVILNLAGQWSVDYSTGIKKFSQIPTVSLELWTRAYQFIKSNPKISKNDTPETIEFFIPGTNNPDLSFKSMDMVWESFADFKENNFKLFKTIIPTNGEIWYNGTCDCPEYFKQMICLHIVGMAIRCKYVKAPPEAKNIPIGQKRKRGRPTKAKPALFKQ